jgi:excisionase family DNA binding protein
MEKSTADIPLASTATEISGPADEQEVQPEYLTYRQAEVLTNLSRVTLWRIISAGEVKVSRIGRAVRIHRRSLEDYMERAADV